MRHYSTIFADVLAQFAANLRSVSVEKAAYLLGKTATLWRCRKIEKLSLVFAIGDGEGLDNRRLDLILRQKPVREQVSTAREATARN